MCWYGVGNILVFGQILLNDDHRTLHGRNRAYRNYKILETKCGFKICIVPTIIFSVLGRCDI